MFESVDPYMKGIEDAMKLPPGITSRQMVPEIVARLFEIPIDVVANDITAAKVMKGILGVIFSLAPQYIGPMITKGWRDRDTEDNYAIAKMWLLEMTDPTSDDLVKIANAVQNVRAALQFGDPNRFWSIFGVKSWQQIQADWANVANAFASAFGMPSAKAPTKPGAGAGGGKVPVLYKETLSGPGNAQAAPATPAAPTAIAGVKQMFRFTQDHMQPGATGIAPRFRLTLN